MLAEPLTVAIRIGAGDVPLSDAHYMDLVLAVGLAVHVRDAGEIASAIRIFSYHSEFALAGRMGLYRAIANAVLVEAAVLADAVIADIAFRAAGAVVASLWRLFRSR